MKDIPLILYGAGVIGCRIANFLLDKEGIKIVGVVDIAKDKVGKDLGEILGIEKRIGVSVTDDADTLFSKVKADIVVHTTTSYLKDTYPQIAGCIKAGLNVVSTCESLSWPYLTEPDLAKKLDDLAKEHGVSILGTGINPGYLMDTLPITLSGACQEVRKIEVTRMMDSGKRRIPFQKKIGTGLSPEEFRKRIDEGIITGHVGLVESIAMVAAALAWELDEIKELPPEAVIAEEEITTPYTTVKPGNAAGLKSVAYGAKGGEKLITLNFIANAAVKEEYDSVTIDGVPPINEKIIGGVHGDYGTIAVTTNMIPKVINAPPGLYTMKDLPVPSGTPEHMAKYIKGKD